MKTLKFLLLLMILPAFAQAQPGHILLREGNKNYKSEDYTAAEEQYRKSLEKEKPVAGIITLATLSTSRNALRMPSNIMKTPSIRLIIMEPGPTPGTISAMLIFRQKNTIKVSMPTKTH